MKPTNDQKYTVKEYLAYEIDQGQKFEFHDGFLYALAGGSLNHALSVGNIYAELRTALKGKPTNCKPITSEAKLHIQQDNKLIYPDAMVVCGAIEPSAYTNEALVNPTVMVKYYPSQRRHTIGVINFIFIAKFQPCWNLF